VTRLLRGLHPLRRVLTGRFVVPVALSALVGTGALTFVLLDGQAQGGASGGPGGANGILVALDQAGTGAPQNPTPPKQPKNTGTSNASVRIYRHGRLVAYGNSAILYEYPPQSYIPAGQALFETFCSSCHGTDASGTSRAPNLVGLGPATVDFWVTTGRMPAENPNAVQAPRKPAKLTDKQALEIAAWVNSLDPSEPAIPHVNLKHANLSDGFNLFSLNCAACHTITGAGDALAYGTYAPSLRSATPTQVAEAIRTGPGNMPRFTGNLTDKQVRDLVAYVTEKIQHPSNPGGFALGGVGPVAEGFVALLFGVGVLTLVAYWIGERA